MATTLPGGYVLDAADPRAPTDEQWAQMTAEERARAVEMLPSEFELGPPPELAIVDERLRFFHGTAALEDADELIAKLGSMLNDAFSRREEAESRATAEAERAAKLERQLAEALAEIERLKLRT